MATKKAKKTVSAGVTRIGAKAGRRPKPAVTTAKTSTKKSAKVEAPVALPKRAAAKAGNASAASDASAAIDVGSRAPSFVLKDSHGTLVSSESLRGSPYVMYFYPKDDTPGCTLQACAFRDSLPRFDAKGVKIIGVSPDTEESHARFQKKHNLNFTLLSDPEKTLTKAYGVWGKRKNYGKEYMGVIRSTFYVDRRGVIQKIWRAVKVPGHVDQLVHSV